MRLKHFIGRLPNIGDHYDMVTGKGNCTTPFPQVSMDCAYNGGIMILTAAAFSSDVTDEDFIAEFRRSYFQQSG